MVGLFLKFSLFSCCGGVCGGGAGSVRGSEGGGEVERWKGI